MRIISLAADLSPIYPEGRFDLACWERTLSVADPELTALCLQDMNADIAGGLGDDPSRARCDSAGAGKDRRAALEYTGRHAWIDLS